MELQQMRYVLAVAETGSFTRAAAQCFVVQSALSHQIAALERELGFKLFARTSRRVELTAAGTALLPAAKQSVESAERAIAEAAAAAGEVRGRLTVGAIPTVTAIDIPDTLQRFRRAHPQVRISLRTAGSDELMAGVRSGDTDVALLGLPESTEPRGVSSQVLARDRLVAVVSVNHGLAQQDRVDLGRLARETFADFPAGTTGRAQADQAFASAGIQREVAYEVMSVDLMTDLVREGLAVAFLPSAFTRNLPGVATLAISGGPSRTEYLIWSDFNPSPATIAFLEILRTG